ncbi:hypothetical protein EDD15DRAFT_2194727 [Pisolithus albus]|nr:hypothetical protein EDD15DRAFT_2194727 [Pisolithus albus]
MSRVCYQNPQARTDDLMLAFAYDTLHVSQRNQTFECLPTPSGSPTHPRSSTTIQGLDGLWLPTGRSTYDTTRQAILDGVPMNWLRLCTMNGSAWQRKPADIGGRNLRIPQQKLFHPVQVEHVMAITEITDTVINDLEYNILGYGRRIREQRLGRVST